MTESWLCNDRVKNGPTRSLLGKTRWWPSHDSVMTKSWLDCLRYELRSKTAPTNDTRASIQYVNTITLLCVFIWVWLLFCNRFAQIFDFAFGQLKYLGLFFGSGLVSHLQFGCFHIGHRGFSFWSFKKCQEIDVERIFKKRMIFVKKSFWGFSTCFAIYRSLGPWTAMFISPGLQVGAFLDSLNLISCTPVSGHLKVFMPLSKSEYELLSGSSQKRPDPSRRIAK